MSSFQAKAVLFDLDGTLYRRTPYLRRRLTTWLIDEIRRGPFHTVRAVWAAVHFWRVRKKLRTLGRRTDLKCEQFELAAERSGLSEAFVREVMNGYIYENIFPGMSAYLFTDVYETLESLKRRGLKLGVLSEYPVDAKLRSLGLDRISWDLLMSCEDANALKPDPHAFAVACERLGVEPAGAIFVGDRPDLDIQGAKAAGMKTVLMKADGWSWHRGADADFTVSTYSELLQIVDVLLARGPEQRLHCP